MSSQSNPQLFSGADWVPPRDVERVWKGKDKHYATNTFEPYDRPRALWYLKHDAAGPGSPSILDRAITRYGPNGRLESGLIPGWPIRREQQRPWLEKAPPEVLPQVGDQLMCVVESADNGHVVLRIVKGLSLVAAVLLSMLTTLDVLSDGKLDGVITWCHLFGPDHFRV